MSPISENGVILVEQYGDEVVLAIPTVLLTALQAAWQSDLEPELQYEDVVRAVRDLFDGEDGALQYLVRIGIETRPT